MGAVLGEVFPGGYQNLETERSWNGRSLIVQTRGPQAMAREPNLACYLFL